MLLLWLNFETISTLKPIVQHYYSAEKSPDVNLPGREIPADQANQNKIALGEKSGLSKTNLGFRQLQVGEGV